MAAAISPDPSHDFEDPRHAGGFQPVHWPAANGAQAPPWAEAGRNERRRIEFLASYYRLNILNGHLLSLRESGGPVGEALRAVDAAMEAHESLEDRYASIGFYGDPEMDGVFYRNILFPRSAQPLILSENESPGVCLSSHLAVPGLEEIPREELYGPAVVTRWEDGKVDL